MVRRILLGCGALTGALYVIADGLMAASYPGYSYLHHTVSELNAFGAPTRGLSIVFGVAGYLLLIPFGVGMWLAASGHRSLRIAGGALMVLGVIGLWGVPFAAMQPRGTEQPVSHALSAIAGVVLLVIAMGCAAVASGNRFRLYSIATLVVMLLFGAWSALDAGNVAAGLVTPWVGVKERISFYSWHLWLIALAVMVLRQQAKNRVDGGTLPQVPIKARAIVTEPSGRR